MTFGSTAGFGEQPAMASDASSSVTFRQAIFMAVLCRSYVDGFGTGSFLRQWPAPAGQIIGIRALGQLRRPFKRTLDVTLDQFALHAPAQEIRPDEFAERRRILGVAAGAAQFAGQRAERIVDQIGD